MKPWTAAKTFTVYELINEKLREIYVGRTSDMIFTLTDPRNRAREIAHWDPADVRAPRSIEFDLNERDALFFIDSYVRTPLPEGWRYVK